MSNIYQKPSKYKNHRTEVDGIKFASKKEARWWIRLKEREDKGEISNLTRQVRYEFPVPNGILRHVPSNRPVYYIADFVYIENGKTIVADAKGVRTPEYKLKAALMLHLNGITILEL